MNDSRDISPSDGVGGAGGAGGAGDAGGAGGVDMHSLRRWGVPVRRAIGGTCATHPTERSHTMRRMTGCTRCNRAFVIPAEAGTQ